MQSVICSLDFKPTIFANIHHLIPNKSNIHIRQFYKFANIKIVKKTTINIVAINAIILSTLLIF